jgi:UDP-N-acetylmuramoyl-L-alanyl-D-glutamate--2,6-diaminopimelate ligase
LDGLEGVKVFNFQEREITGMAYDSRRVKPGYLFVAIQGSKADGHAFLIEAIRRGAVAIVIERMAYSHQEDTPGGLTQIVVPSSRKALAYLSSCFYGEPSKRLTCIGITGTNGKTTSSYLLRSILKTSGKRVGLIGTVTCFTGERCIPSSHTTPESLELHGLFREMVDAGITHVAMEVSSHALVQHRVDGIDFKAAIFTNLSQEHLDYHQDMETYREAKALLFRGLSPEAVAVLNAEDAASQYLAQQTQARVLWYYPEATRGIRAEILSTTLEGTEILLSDGQEGLLVNSPLIGRHNLYNLLAAATTAKALGVGLSDIKKGIESMEVPPGRLERISGQGFQVFIDYAHTPHALESALETLKPLVENRLLLVFGCGGDRDRGKRPLMGQVAERYCDLFWITSDNPRSEPPMQIIKEIKRGISGRSYRVEPDRRLAIEQALSQAGRGDVVLVAGKGHEQTQDLGKLVVPFDDGEVVRAFLSRKSSTEKERVEGMEELQHAGLSGVGKA